MGFKPHFAICICHNEQRLIVVKKGYCAEGNYEQKQRKKNSDISERNSTDSPMLRRGWGHKVNVGTTKNTNGKGFGKLYPKKPTGEREVFKQIVDSLGDKRECFVCGRQLGELTASNFAHILPKALNKYPLFKLNPDNIKLFCHDSYSSCHHRFDKEPRSTLKEPMWKKVFELEEKLKEEYKNLKSSL